MKRDARAGEGEREGEMGEVRRERAVRQTGVKERDQSMRRRKTDLYSSLYMPCRKGRRRRWWSGARLPGTNEERPFTRAGPAETTTARPTTSEGRHRRRQQDTARSRSTDHPDRSAVDSTTASSVPARQPASSSSVAFLRPTSSNEGLTLAGGS